MKPTDLYRGLLQWSQEASRRGNESLEDDILSLMDRLFIELSDEDAREVLAKPQPLTPRR